MTSNSTYLTFRPHSWNFMIVVLSALLICWLAFVRNVWSWIDWIWLISISFAYFGMLPDLRGPEVWRVVGARHIERVPSSHFGQTSRSESRSGAKRLIIEPIYLPFLFQSVIEFEDGLHPWVGPLNTKWSHERRVSANKAFADAAGIAFINRLKGDDGAAQIR